MKRLLWLLLLIPLMGCMTANQLAAEKAFYEAKILISRQAQAQPIFEMTAANEKEPIVLYNVSALRVFNAPSSNGDSLQQYVQRDYVQPWLNVLGAALPWFGAWGIVKAVADIPKANITTNTNSNNLTSTNTSTASTFTNTASGGSVANMGGGSATLNNVLEAPVVVVPPVSYPPK